MKPFLSKLFLSLSLTTAAIAQADNKVLLIGVDGTQLEKLQAVNTPSFDQLHITKAWTGGIEGTNTEQGTSSGPGWSINVLVLS